MAKLRSEHSPDIPFHCYFQNKGRSLKTVLFVPKAIVYVCFCAIRAVARIFPLHLPGVLERRRFWGGVSALEGHLPVLEGLRGALASRAFGCSGALSGRFGAAPRLVQD